MNTIFSDIYVVKHSFSDSHMEMQCVLDEDKHVKIHTMKMISGNVISLAKVREAIIHFKEQNFSVPDEIA